MQSKVSGLTSGERFGQRLNAFASRLRFEDPEFASDHISSSNGKMNAELQAELPLLASDLRSLQDRVSSLENSVRQFHLEPQAGIADCKKELQKACRGQTSELACVRKELQNLDTWVQILSRQHGTFVGQVRYIEELIEGTRGDAKSRLNIAFEQMQQFQDEHQLSQRCNIQWNDWAALRLNRLEESAGNHSRLFQDMDAMHKRHEERHDKSLQDAQCEKETVTTLFSFVSESAAKQACDLAKVRELVDEQSSSISNLAKKLHEEVEIIRGQMDDTIARTRAELGERISYSSDILLKRIQSFEASLTQNLNARQQVLDARVGLLSQAQHSSALV